MGEDGKAEFCSACRRGGELVTCCVRECPEGLCLECLSYPVPEDPVDWMCWICVTKVERFAYKDGYTAVAIGNKHFQVADKCFVPAAAYNGRRVNL